jgi:uncharacterized protein with HEPN domain
VSLDRVRERLETILKRRSRPAPRPHGFRDLLNDPDEIDLTAFRLSVIGENANKLSDEVKGRHPSLPWKGMYGFRNLVSHEYSTIAPRFVWAATQELEPIRAMCRVELDRIRSAEA